MNDHDSEPRSGLLRVWDRLVGPGATAVENLGIAGAAVLGAAIAGTSGSTPAWSRDPIRRGVAVMMGLDLFGGVWVNATPAATRWYHGRGQGTREMLAFSASGCCGVWMNTAVWRPTPGMGWFAPAFFLKLLVSHAAGGAPK